MNNINVWIYGKLKRQPNNTKKARNDNVPYIFMQSDNFILFGDTLDTLSAAS